MKCLISLTTHAGRAACITKTVANLVRQAAPMDARVCISVGPGVKDLFDADLKAAASGGLVDVIEVPEDFGSNMKYMPAMMKYPDTPLIAVDDDNLFHDGTLAGMLMWRSRFPRTIICRRYREIAWEPDGTLARMTFRSYPLHKCTSLPRGFFELVVNGFPEHCAGCLYPPGCLGVTEASAAEAKEKAPRDDDVFAHVLALRAGVSTMLIHDPCYLLEQRDKNDPTLKATGLWTNGGNGARTTETLRRFENELRAHRNDRF